MIYINFAKRKKAEAGTRTNLTLQLGTDQLREYLPLLRELPIKKYAIVLIISYAANYGLNTYKDTQIHTIDEEIQKLENEKPRLEAETGKMKGLEQLKNSMDVDGNTMSTKLETIKKLMVDRGTVLKLMLELTKTIPSDVWITHADFHGSDLGLIGYSLDFSKISDFMKQLDGSSVFSDATLKDTQMAKDNLNREVASFTISTRKR